MQEWINGVFDVLVGEIYKVLFFDIYGFPLIVLTLLFGSITFTLYFKFINFRAFKHSIEVIKGKYDNPDDKGQISHFQALTSALSGTIGLGNIAGVAIAVTVGGPGAVFWMMFIAIFSMSAKFVSGTLSQMYRKINSDGSIDGGPMYYLDMGLKETGRPKLGRFLGVLYAIFIIGGALGGGNMFQSNQSFALVSNQLPFLENFGWLYGLILAVLVGAVIIGGIKRIGKATEKIVPLMVMIYILASLFIIFTNIERIPGVISLIFSEAFNASAIYGGLIGSIVQGIRRAVFSNEGGVGSASIAHSAAKTDEPVREGIVAMIGPFIDTIVICFMTACVILITREDNSDYKVYQYDLKHQLISKELDELDNKETSNNLQKEFIDTKKTLIENELYDIENELFLLGFGYQEDFTDTNLNEQWDPAEPFDDLDGNKQWSPAEYFIDNNENGVYDSDCDEFTDSNLNGQWDPAEPFDDLDGNKQWSPAEPFKDTRGNLKYDTADIFLLDMNDNLIPDDSEYYSDLNVNGQWDLNEPYLDFNNNGVWDKIFNLPCESFQIYSTVDIFHAVLFCDSTDDGFTEADEYFIDQGNGTWDIDEEFIDTNENGIWDECEEFTDIGNSIRDDNEFFLDTPNGKWDGTTDKAEGAILTSSAFGSVITWFPAILTIVVFLFSYSTMISWYYYGDKSWTYLFGKKSIRVFQVIYLSCVVLGAIASLSSIIDFSDMMLLSAAFPNIIGVMFLLPKLRNALNVYWNKYQNKEFKTYKTSFVKDLFRFKK